MDRLGRYTRLNLVGKRGDRGVINVPAIDPREPYAGGRSGGMVFVERTEYERITER